MSTAIKNTVVWTCAVCETSRSKPETRLPKGWKRKGEKETICETCWRKQYILRAITVPIVTPIDLSWPELRALLREMWVGTTQASNWMTTELYARDVRRGDEEKMPAMPPVYLYPEARIRFPQMPSQSIACLEQQTKAKYRAKRYDVIWTCSASPPTYRYPTPFPVPNRGWSLDLETDVPIVSVRLGDQRVRLRLKGGPRFHKQLGALRDIASGEAVQGQLDIYKRGNDLLCKMAAWLPRDPDRLHKQRIGTLYVRTDADALLVALDAKAGKLWTYHGDQVPRWSSEHRKHLQRWADDSKAEHRPGVPFGERREAAALKYRNRMNSVCHQIAAMIAGYAGRRRFATVEYRDAETTFCADFPWFRLRQLIAEKCDAVGVQFEYASGDGLPVGSEPLAEE